MIATDQFDDIMEIFQEFERSIITQKSSSMLLLMNVEDILGFAQIKAGAFSKIVRPFNIK